MEVPRYVPRRTCLRQGGMFSEIRGSYGSPGFMLHRQRTVLHGACAAEGDFVSEIRGPYGSPGLVQRPARSV